MEGDRIKRAKSRDGTEIAGRVQGKGPPLVLFHGGDGDGDGDWAAMLPHLTEHFTCYLPSMRGRGLSADHDDQRPERHAEDLAAFIDSIGEPVHVVGWSTGGFYAFGAAQRGAAISSLAVYEAPVFECWEKENDATARFRDGVAGMFAAAAEGQLVEAARAFHRGVANDEEMAELESEGAFEHFGANTAALVRVLEQASKTEAANPTDASQLERIALPVLLVYGSKTTAPHIESIYTLAERLPKSKMREIAGAGHMGPVLKPGPIAGELIRFFTEA